MRILRRMFRAAWTAAAAMFGTVGRMCGWASDHAKDRMIDGLRDELFDANHKVKLLEAEKLRAERSLSQTLTWEQKLLERDRAEAQIHAARRIAADGLNSREE